ncbi:MAG TPA: hypothetical protein VHE99_11680 [Gammaproteobacteria bacterium]|nr:hypothetical protein [Gammaproteobacteria bacterium]
MVNMTNDWPTQQEDMQTASSIVDKHSANNDGEPLGFLEVIVYRGEKGKVELKMPDWILEIQSSFREQYGHEHGHAVTSKVLTKLLLKNETVH